MNSSWKFWRKIVLAAATCSAIWGITSFVYYWDPTRVIIKRIVAKDPFRYEEILPQFLKFNPEKEITIRSAKGAETRRKALASIIWGSPELPADYSLGPPATIDIDAPIPADCSKIAHYHTPLPCGTERYRDIANLAEVTQREFAIPPHYRSYVDEFRPQDWNGWIVFYQHGYAGTYHDQHRNIARLIERGYSVLAFNLPGLGGNVIMASGLASVRQTLGPIMLALEHSVRRRLPKGIAMIGFSAGGLAAVRAAALEPRIRVTYSVAAPIYPVALTDPKLEPPGNSRLPELLESAGYLDLFVLGTSGSKDQPRRQLQIFNQYDRCCWRNRTALLYADSVKQAALKLGGTFDVRIDESHARHKISRQTMEWILADLERIRS
ncbi:MAG: alpha/beta hydrolase [Rhodospirillales bacterium]|nr:alpha/beta hydrolase [Rhodospirillales bacterium]